MNQIIGMTKIEDYTYEEKQSALDEAWEIMQKDEEVVEKTVTIEVPGIDKWPITHLRKACRKNKIKGYTKMDREQLVMTVEGILERFNEVDKRS